MALNALFCKSSLKAPRRQGSFPLNQGLLPPPACFLRPPQVPPFWEEQALSVVCFPSGSHHCVALPPSPSIVIYGNSFPFADLILGRSSRQPG